MKLKARTLAYVVVIVLICVGIYALYYDSTQVLLNKKEGIDAAFQCPTGSYIKQGVGVPNSFDDCKCAWGLTRNETNKSCDKSDQPNQPSFLSGLGKKNTQTPAVSNPNTSSGTCIRNKDCSKNPWCNDSSYDTWCSQNKASCPSPFCIMGTSGAAAGTGTTPSPTTPGPAPGPGPGPGPGPAPTTPSPTTPGPTTPSPTTPSPGPGPAPGPGPGPAPGPGPGPGTGTNRGPTSTGWDDAYFFSGGMGGMYNTSDISYKNTDKSLSANPSTGADPSCGAGDPKTLKKCMNKEKYNLNYASPYQSGIDNNCKNKDGHIQFVNPTKQGKVASIAHGTFGQGVSAPDAACSIGKYDTSVDGTGTDGQRPKAFSNRVNQLYSIMSNCGKDTKNYTKVFDIDGTNKSCLITKQAFKDAKVPLPDAEGEVPISNDGVAISAGHGVGKGSCGQLSLLQQGNQRGTNPQPNPGNTVLNVQIDTRAWSGEWGDTMDSGPQKYLIHGMDVDVSGQTCLQPRMRVLTKAEGNNLLSTVCSAMPGGACQIESGTCNGESKCKNQTKAWCDAVPECTWTSTGTVPIGTTPSPTTPSPTTPSPTTPSPTTPSPTTPSPTTPSPTTPGPGTSGPGPSAGNIQFLGGWSNCTKSTTWRTAWGCNTILIGPFGGTRPILCESDRPYTNIWYTIGGEGINPTLDANLINTALNYYKGPAGQVNGICFDIESGLTLDMVRAWLKQYGAQAKAAGLQYLVATPQESTTMPEVTDGFTHVALMMYTGNQSYPSYDPFVGNFAGYDINNLIKNGWPSSKLMFTYQSYSASNYSGAATMFKNMVSACTTSKTLYLNAAWKGGPKYKFQGPFAGILAWPAQEDKQPCQPQRDIKNMKLVLQAMGLSTNININCSSTSGSDTTPSPTTPSPTTPSPTTPSPTTPSPATPGPRPYDGNLMNSGTIFSYDTGVSSIVNSLYKNLPVNPTKDGWITSSASCFGHYDWVNNKAMGCQYPIGDGPISQGDISKCLEYGGAAGALPGDKGFTNTTCADSTPNVITKKDLDTGYTAAFNHKYWPDPYNSQCGKCAIVKCDPSRPSNGRKCKPGAGPIKVKIVDKMMETSVYSPAKYLRNLDLNDNAFAALVDTSGEDKAVCSGAIPMLWKPAPCGDTITPSPSSPSSGGGGTDKQCPNGQYLDNNICKKAVTPPNKKTVPVLVYSGGNQWKDLINNPGVKYIVLASAIRFTRNAVGTTGGGFGTNGSGFVNSAGVLPGLSFGGSNGGGLWPKLKNYKNFNDPSPDDSATYKQVFDSIYNQGIRLIDWDFEGVADTDGKIFDGISKLSSDIKSAHSDMKISLTIFGNPDKRATYEIPSATAIANSDIDIVNLMLYNGGQWVGFWAEPKWSYGWCGWFEKFVNAGYSKDKLGKEIYLSLYPTPSTNLCTARKCCGECASSAVRLIADGHADGIGLWAYGGYLGGSNNTVNNDVIPKYIETIYKKGTQADSTDFESAWPNGVCAKVNANEKQRCSSSFLKSQPTSIQRSLCTPSETGGSGTNNNNNNNNNTGGGGSPSCPDGLMPYANTPTTGVCSCGTSWSDANTSGKRCTYR